MADKVFTMRIDEELLVKVRLSAEKNKRSLAKEVEFVLENFYLYNPDFGEKLIVPEEHQQELVNALLKYTNFLEISEKLKNQAKKVEKEDKS